MKTYCASPDQARFDSATPFGAEQDFDDDSTADGRAELRDRWQPLLTESPGARLFRIVPPLDAAVEWHAEITTPGDVQQRRFSSEIRARAWIAIQNKPSFILSGLDLAELSQRFRASFLRGG